MSSSLRYQGFFSANENSDKKVAQLAQQANELAIKVLVSLQNMSGNPIQAYSKVDPNFFSDIKDAVVDKGGYDINPGHLAAHLAAALKISGFSIGDNAKHGLESLPDTVAKLVAEQAKASVPAPSA